MRSEGGGSGGGDFFAQLRERVEKFDSFPKFVQSANVQTTSGALVSIVTIVAIITLVVMEFSWYWTIDKVERMEVDSERNEMLKINFDITFPAVPCSMVSVDAQDITGQRQQDLMHNIFKRRLRPDGTQVGQAMSNSLGGTLISQDELLAEKNRAIQEGRATFTEDMAKSQGKDCGPCYGAGDPGQCCSTCDEVRELYRRRGWSFDPANVEQCKHEGLVGDATTDKNEGCSIYGFVRVPKVAGNVHFAPSSGFQALHTQMSDLVDFTHERFNASHIINELSFGTFFPERTDPLDGVTRVTTRDGAMVQYYLKVVPTEYEFLSGRKVLSNQYSVTEHTRFLNQDSRGLPGVYLNYDLSPIRVHIIETRRSFGHFLVGLCAVVGGVFTVAGMLDGLLFRLLGGAPGSRRDAGMFSGFASAAAGGAGASAGGSAYRKVAD